jgi:hypothetical protein
VFVAHLISLLKIASERAFRLGWLLPTTRIGPAILPRQGRSAAEAPKRTG